MRLSSNHEISAGLTVKAVIARMISAYVQVCTPNKPGQGRSQKLVLEGDRRGGLGTKSPGGPGAEPWWVSEGEAPRSCEDIYANNHCNNVLTKKP